MRLFSEEYVDATIKRGRRDEAQEHDGHHHRELPVRRSAALQQNSIGPCPGGV
jgi:hypothetical protein